MDFVSVAEVAVLAYLAGIISVVTPFAIVLYKTRDDEPSREESNEPIE